MLRIRESKFHKSRLGTFVLERNGRTADLSAAATASTFAAHQGAMPLLCNRHLGHLHPYSHPGLQGAINLLFDCAGVPGRTRQKHPRVHDLRHTFAVQALVRWYRDGADVQACLPKLALFMGHVSIESSAYSPALGSRIAESGQPALRAVFRTAGQGRCPMKRGGATDLWPAPYSDFFRTICRHSEG